MERGKVYFMDIADMDGGAVIPSTYKPIDENLATSDLDVIYNSKNKNKLADSWVILGLIARETQKGKNIVISLNNNK